MKGFRYNHKNLFFVRFNEGEDILRSMRKAVADYGIKNAVIVSGLGSIVSYHFHVIDSFVNPPREVYPKGEQPCDIVNINGFVIDGRVHAHITISDSKVAFGGHLEEGCKILTFGVVTMAEMVDADFKDWDAIKDI